MHSIINRVDQAELPYTSPTTQKKSPGEAQQSFTKHLKEAIEDVNDLQKTSDAKTESLAKNKAVDLHDVMVEAQKASIALETSVQIQRKVIDAYNEIMRMQV